MNEPFNEALLEQLINNIQMATSPPEPLYCHVYAWRIEVLAHPERFRFDSNNNLIYLRYPVGLIGPYQEREKFLHMIEMLDVIERENKKL